MLTGTANAGCGQPSSIRTPPQGLCSGLRISATAVSCDVLDLGLPDQPGLGSRRFSVGQQGDRLSPLKVADDGAISMIATQRPSKPITLGGVAVGDHTGEPFEAACHH